MAGTIATRNMADPSILPRPHEMIQPSHVLLCQGFPASAYRPAQRIDRV